MSPILPPKVKQIGNSVYLPAEMWKFLKEVAKDSGYRMSDVLRHFLEWWLAKDAPLPPKPPKPIARTIYLPEELWDEAEEKGDEHGYSRNDVIRFALNESFAAYLRERDAAARKR